MGDGTSDLGQLGLFLTLVFVLPGFVYLGFFILYFPEKYECLKNLYPSGFLEIYLAVIGGLLLTSICFGFEIMLRNLNVFEKWFPDMGADKMPLIEYKGKGVWYLNQLTGQAYMHFNIFMGIFFILILYVSYRLLTYQNLSLIKILIGGFVIGFNLLVAHTFYKWGKNAIESVFKEANT
ncbi:MAG: hypothetical protein WC568_00445 [Candidatus Methanoperedens sp.]